MLTTFFIQKSATHPAVLIETMERVLEDMQKHNLTDREVSLCWSDAMLLLAYAKRGARMPETKTRRRRGFPYE